MTEITEKLREKEIVITHTAKSKAFRMLQPYEIESAIRECRGHLFSRKHADDEYHLLTPKDVVLVLQEEESVIVVITQMHDHEHHHKSEDYNLITYNAGEFA